MWTLTVHEDYLFSAGSGSIIQVTNAVTLEHVDTLRGHSGDVYALTASGNRLFSAAADRTVLWFR